MNKQNETFSKLYEQCINPAKTNGSGMVPPPPGGGGMGYVVYSNEINIPSENMEMRTFPSGATRHTDEDKLDYEGFLSPLVLQRYAEYLHSHRVQADGKLRASDNWQKGIPKVVYMKSLLRHLLNVWRHHRNYPAPETLEESLCAVMFNTMGYLFETLRTKETKIDIQPGSNE